MVSTTKQPNVQAPASRTSAAPTFARRFKFFQRLGQSKLAVGMLIFSAAFGLRFWHNATLEHRVWYLEDAQNYLRSGTAILRMVADSKSPSQFIDNVTADAKKYSGLYFSFDSDKLVDRMLADGAVFPIYLSGVEAACGLNPHNPQYERIPFNVSILNSLLDSTTCALIFLLGASLFGSTVGFIAGLLYAIYPAAVVNTQWCMSETFCTFMLVASMYAVARLVQVPPLSVPRQIGGGIASGILLGLTILSRPAFPILLPLLGGAILIAGRAKKKLLPAFLSLVLALGVSVTPWLAYTNMVLGQPRLTTNRLPAFNMLSGNLVKNDGHTPYPNKLAFPEGMKECVAMIAEDAKSHPVDFALLQMKKIARLWSNVWNDCKFPVLGLNAAAQTVFHQLLLFLAMCWGLIACRRGREKLSSSEMLGTSLIVAILVLHSVYQAFIAVARYELTAMPFVILAAAAAIAAWMKSDASGKKQFAVLLIAFCATAGLTNEFRSVSHFVSGLVNQPWWLDIAPWLTASVAILGYAAVWLYAVRTLPAVIHPAPKHPSRLLPAVALTGFALTACGIIGSIIGSHTWSEWGCKVTNQSLKQTIALPAEMEPVSPSGYVLVDLQNDAPLPEMQVELNGRVLTATALPLTMLQLDNEVVLRSIAIQAGCMDKDFRAIRNWYAVEFPTNLLRRGGENSIVVRNLDPTNPFTVYGDYIQKSKSASDGEQVLPSVNSLSFNYTIEGADYRNPLEPRLREPVEVFGKTTESALISSSTTSKDLSDAPGRQWGHYRVRLLLRPTRVSNPSPKASPIQQASTIFEQQTGTVHTAHGGDPTTFYLTKGPVAVEESRLASQPIRFTCEIKTAKRPLNAYVNLVFKTGIGDVWTPDWQPDSIPVDAKAWKKVTIIDSFPKKLLEHDGVSTAPLIMPCGKDLVFTNSKKASKQFVLVRNAKLEFLPCEIPAHKDFFSWKLF